MGLPKTHIRKNCFLYFICEYEVVEMRFIGRQHELEELNQLYVHNDAKLVVIYGRRRVGKSTLIEKFMEEKNHLRFEGLERAHTPEQIKQFVHDLSLQLNEPILKKTSIQAWEVLFDYLTKYFDKQTSKQILFLDEFQWLAAGRSTLVSLIKKYWDQHWKKQNVMLILCGSVSSYMVKKVIQSRALYGRINWELCLQPFSPKEILQLIDHKRSREEILQYALILGGVPKYLQEIDCRYSFEQNINKMFFTQNGIMVKEYEKIFYSQFKEHSTYEQIINYLKDGPRSLKEIALKLKIPSGGGIKSYLDNLERALFITSYVPFDRQTNSKLKKYKVTDEYLRFYFKYVAPNLKLITSNQKNNLFARLVKPVWLPWLGFSFENFCLKYSTLLAKIMGFEELLVNWGPLYSGQDQRFQIDLVYSRSDKVITMCEIKYHDKPITASIIKEVEKKCQLIQLPRGYTLEKALIAKYGADHDLKESGYFTHIISMDDFFNE